MTTANTSRDVLNKFMAKNEAHYIFACQASVPLLLTPDLLYQLWNNFKQYQYVFEPTEHYKIAHIAVSDLLLSPLCKKVGFELYEMEQGVRNLLLEDLLSNLGKKRRNTIAAFLEDYALLEHRYAHRKGLKNIHLLTAQSILNPAEMERQIIGHINAAQTDAEKLNYLLLHKNLLPIGFESDLAHITTQLPDLNEPLLSPILIAEENAQMPGVLHVKLPAALKGKMRRISQGAVKPPAQEGSLAEKLIAACMESKSPALDLGNCGLSDADFTEGSPVTEALRQCSHVHTLMLSNSWVQPLNATRQRSQNEKAKNRLSAIPTVVAALVNLTRLFCSGEPHFSWGITTIRSLPASLVCLDLSYNQIQDVSALQQLQNLELLFLCFNRIKALNGIDSFHKLRILDLRANEVQDISPLLFLLQRTPTPLIVNCNELAPVNNFEINVFANPVNSPPYATVLQGNTAILDYFKRKDVKDPQSRQEMIKKRSMLVGCIHANGVLGTGFLVKGNVLNEAFGDELLLVTVNYVVDNQRFLSNKSYVTFEALDQNITAFETGEMLWASASDELDTAVLHFTRESRIKLNELTRNAEFYPVAANIAAESLQQEVTVIGHSGGGQLQVTSDKNGIIDYNDRFFRYTAPTAPGSAGSPVFNDQWELLGVHHAGQRQVVVPGSREVPSTVNEGIRISSIKAAISRTQRRNIKIFISSSEELIKERDLLTHAVADTYESWLAEKRIQIDWVTKDSFIASNITLQRRQVREAIQNCDIFMLLASMKMSKYATQDLDFALEQFRKKGRPNVIVFLKESSNDIPKYYEDWVYMDKLYVDNQGEYFTGSDDLLSAFLSRLDAFVTGKPKHPEIDPALLTLAADYEKTRASMRASEERTMKLTDIVYQMKEIAGTAIPVLTVLTQSHAAGERLVAIATLQRFPEMKYLDWLANRIGDDEKPFIGYHASVALLEAVRKFMKQHEKETVQAWNKAMANIKLSEFKDSNQLNNLSSIHYLLQQTEYFQLQSKRKDPMIQPFAGGWKGIFIERRKRTNFSLETWFDGDKNLLGVMNEEGRTRKADITGEIDLTGEKITFVKNYRITENSNHPVNYTGYWKGALKIAGNWTIPGGASGTFEMEKMVMP